MFCSVFKYWKVYNVVIHLIAGWIGSSLIPFFNQRFFSTLALYTLAQQKLSSKMETVYCSLFTTTATKEFLTVRGYGLNCLYFGGCVSAWCAHTGRWGCKGAIALPQLTVLLIDLTTKHLSVIHPSFIRILRPKWQLWHLPHTARKKTTPKQPNPATKTEPQALYIKVLKLIWLYLLRFKTKGTLRTDNLRAEKG